MEKQKEVFRNVLLEKKQLFGFDIPMEQLKEEACQLHILRDKECRAGDGFKENNKVIGWMKEIDSFKFSCYAFVRSCVVILAIDEFIYNVCVGLEFFFKDRLQELQEFSSTYYTSKNGGKVRLAHILIGLAAIIEENTESKKGIRQGVYERILRTKEFKLVNGNIIKRIKHLQSTKI